ncbi:hypothetical protein ACIPEQ_15165 [Curtobacterium sp. NPDC087080]|uniref:hypothetical protein n=1 Tax=Curtobacterium sp. NPDC087080 TaxID=3363965 RepID=UPI0037F80142
MRTEQDEPSKAQSARGGFIASAVLLLLGLGTAGIPLLAASAGRPIEGGYKLLGDATSGVLFGGILVIAAVVFFVQALRIALRNRRR